MLSGLSDDDICQLEEIKEQKADILDDQGVQFGHIVDSRGWRSLEMFLLPFARNGVLVAEDEVYLNMHISILTNRARERHTPWYPGM